MLFNRSSDEPLANEIDRVRLSTTFTVDRRILAANLRRDGRVSSVRGDKFVADTRAFLDTEKASGRSDPAYSEACRSAFRNDVDQHSEVVPISIPN